MSPKAARVTSRTRLMSRLKSIFGRYFVVKNALALTFLVGSFAVLVPLLRQPNDWLKVGLAIYGTIILVLCVLLVGEFAVKVIRLQVEPGVRRYSAIVSVNSFFGLLLPMMYLNYVLSYVMRALASINEAGTFWCELRKSVTRMYYQNGMYWQINSIITHIFLLIVILFLFGPLFERARRRD
jgi:hypothetical protein